MVEHPLISVEDLWIRFRDGNRVVEAVRGVSFDLGREKLGVVGESGSGKSQTGRAIMRLTPKQATMSARRLRFKETDLVAAGERDMLQIRGRHIGMILQDPKFALNPLMTVGEQIAETARWHLRVNKSEARERALAMLEAVRIRNPKRVFDLFPHEVSGGMGQRIMIAIMLVPEPEVLIADEPTSALDVTVRAQVLAVLDDLVAERGLGLILISHDLNMVAGFCDRILVMYKGRIVEAMDAADLTHSTHPYTQGLLASMPKLEHRVDRLEVLDRSGAWADA